MRTLRIIVPLALVIAALGALSPVAASARTLQCGSTGNRTIYGFNQNHQAGMTTTACLSDDYGMPSVVGYGLVKRYFSRIAPMVDSVTLTVTPFVNNQRLASTSCRLYVNNWANYAISEGRCQVPLRINRGQRVQTCTLMTVQLRGLAYPYNSSVCSGAGIWNSWYF